MEPRGSTVTSFSYLHDAKLGCLVGKRVFDNEGMDRKGDSEKFVSLDATLAETTEGYLGTGGGRQSPQPCRLFVRRPYDHKRQPVHSIPYAWISEQSRVDVRGCCPKVRLKVAGGITAVPQAAVPRSESDVMLAIMV